MSSDSPEDVPPSAAMEQLEQGNLREAERLAREAVRAAEAKTPAWAAAQHDLGMVVATKGDYAEATAAFRDACSVGAEPGAAPSRARLTYLLSLGGVLERAEELDEAERVLRECADGRRQVYGEEHPGYAFGLEPLASVQLKKGAFDDAAATVEEAYKILYKAGHPAVASALALRAEVLAARASDKPPFAGLDSVPKSIIEALVGHVLARVEQSDPVVALAVLRHARALATDRLGPRHGRTFQVLAEISNVSRALGEDAAREEALRELVAGLDAVGDKEQALHATLGLALALGEGARGDEALAVYRDALARADALGDRVARADIQRNAGLLLAELGRRPEAEVELRAALTTAAEANDDAAVARARVGLGVFLQHGGDLEGARAELAKGAASLDPEDPDALTARNHLAAIDAGGACGCGDMSATISAAVREMVAQQLPPGLLADLKIDFGSEAPDIQIKLARKPTADEAALVQRVVNEAIERIVARASRV